MFRFVLIVWLVASVSPVLAQEICGFGGEQNFNKTEQLLKQTKTCAEAAKDLNACAWGSSADNMFAGVVIAKCEQEFRGNLSPFADRRYKQELNFCGYEFGKARRHDVNFSCRNVRSRCCR